jgi:hypothetical protein
MDDDVVSILALDAAAASLLSKPAIRSAKWKEIVSDPDVLNTEHWLLAYEANQHGWLKTAAVSKDQHFNLIAKAGVVFYDRTRGIAAKAFTGASAAIPGGALPFDYF